MALQIVTDSTCDLPPAMLRELGVTVVPCNVHFGDEVLRDGVDIKPDEFFKRLGESSENPRTSQPSIGAFVDFSRPLLERGDAIVSVHVSAKLSGTCSSALQAKAELKSERIEVVDSVQASLGLGHQVREAVRIARAGGTAQDVIAGLNAQRANLKTYVTVNTLKYLIRGGRAGRLQGFLAGMLDVKPIIAVIDGETHPVDRVRTRKRALARFTELALESPGTIRALGIVYSDNPAEAEALAQSITSRFPREQIFLAQFSSVMGTHLGPGAMGMSFWTGPAA